MAVNLIILAVTVIIASASSRTIIDTTNLDERSIHENDHENEVQIHVGSNSDGATYKVQSAKINYQAQDGRYIQDSSHSISWQSDDTNENSHHDQISSNANHKYNEHHQENYEERDTSNNVYWKSYDSKKVQQQSSDFSQSQSNFVGQGKIDANFEINDGKQLSHNQTETGINNEYQDNVHVGGYRDYESSQGSYENHASGNLANSNEYSHHNSKQESYGGKCDSKIIEKGRFHKGSTKESVHEIGGNSGSDSWKNDGKVDTKHQSSEFIQKHEDIDADFGINVSSHGSGSSAHEQRESDEKYNCAGLAGFGGSTNGVTCEDIGHHTSGSIQDFGFEANDYISSGSSSTNGNINVNANDGENNYNSQFSSDSLSKHYHEEQKDQNREFGSYEWHSNGNVKTDHQNLGITHEGNGGYEAEFGIGVGGQAGFGIGFGGESGFSIGFGKQNNFELGFGGQSNFGIKIGGQGGFTSGIKFSGRRGRTGSTEENYDTRPEEMISSTSESIEKSD